MISLPKYNGFIQERTVGEYTFLLPDPPNLKEIMNKDLPKEKQKFIRTTVPNGILQWDEKSRLEFEAKEWDKRDDGLWFWNNGNLEYITGANYLFINNWRVEGGFPMFTDAQRDVFLLWKYKVALNTLARGLIFITGRRFGKTHMGNCIGYDTVSKLPELQHMGIQSKSDTDAKAVFNKLIVSWKYLPYYFKPVDSGESNPATTLQFREPSKRDTKNQKKTYAQALNSFIDFENSQEVAYDGQRLEYALQDEIGKDKKNNVYERIQVVKECVFDGGIIGKIFATSTVEEMEKGGGENCKKIWDSADPSPEKLMPNGETQMGLLRYFSPAYYGNREKDTVTGVPMFVDEYGYTDIEKSKQHLLAKRAAIRDSDLLVSERRKYPIIINDCFIGDSKKAAFDLTKIEAQMDFNQSLPPNILTRGNFIWHGGIKDGTVDFHHDENGKWLISWLPPQQDRNKTVIRGAKKAPGNIDTGCFGLDPVDNKTTVDNRKSDAASYGFRRFDPMAPMDSGTFVSGYVNRPKLPEIMWEDMILQCVFYGWEILIESNKIGTINHFRQRGYDRYLMYRPDETQTASSAKMLEPGIPMSGSEARLSLIYATQSYIINKVGIIEEEGMPTYMGRCYFDKLLDNWRQFDLDKDWTKFDSMVGAGLALLGARNKIQVLKKVQAFDMFPKFNMRGSVSKVIRPDGKYL